MTGTHRHFGHGAERYQESRRVTWVSVVLNLLLTVAQIVVGIVGNSHALVADGVHTLSDLVTDVLVLFALSHGAKDADEEHPYGHGRVETAATVILGAVLLAAAVGIAWKAGGRLLDTQGFVIPATTALWVAVFTLAAKEFLYRYTLRTAKRYGSAMLEANAWHHRSDAISSLIVVAGVGGALLGFPYLDAVAAIVVSLLIAKIGVQLGWRALKDLIDTGVGPEERDAIRRVIERVGGVRALHLLRTRRVGDNVFVDVHILVDPHVSVSEGHQIGEVVRIRLMNEIVEISDVTVHVDSEEDKYGLDHPTLPLREEVMERLHRHFQDIPEAKQLGRITLHYGNKRINVELRLPLSVLKNPNDGRALAQRFVEAVRADKDIGEVEVGFY